jgi:NTE family protein
LAKAEAIVGTSAGALVGALLASGREVTEALSSLARLGQHLDPGNLAAGNASFLSAVRQASHGTEPRQALSAIGRAAQEAATLDEHAYLGLFDTLAGTAWPAGFRCPAIDTDTGELVVWNEGSGVSLRAAVAASCALPMLFPVVTIDGRRYMDGGLLSRLNATAAPPADVLVVLSCHPLGPAASETSALGRLATSAHAELAALRETRRVVAIEADLRELGLTEKLMMDRGLAVESHKSGQRQATKEAVVLGGLWNV